MASSACSATMFAKLLIANRGEIACRIIDTARRLGIATLAVYSQADRHARHVRMADAAVCIGAASAAESYLRGARLLEVAAEHGADAIHPGYGFLSENAAFAEACEAAGIVFVGPPAAAIRAMGSKREAKQLMSQAGVPVVPGYHGDDLSDARLQREAETIGWPLLLKASAGGGGKGMRVVETPGAFGAALAAARRESLAAFGDDAMLIERYLQAPRHIEVQIFADAHGQVVHLFERDCSVQRRHQKVLEEAPAPGLDETLRAALGAAAVAAARAIGYRGAGTVEFIAEGGDFYFMEMNTRLQVEHPVTEMITGQDLVAWQLQVATGQPLPLTQQQLVIDGHALEARLYAEDPARGYLPSVGRLRRLRLPCGEGVRVDSGVDEGDAISSHYDPMIGKLITHGRDRAQALARMRQALAATQVLGVATNLGLLQRVVASPGFVRGAVTTGFLAEHPGLAEAPGAPPREVRLLAALALHRAASVQAGTQAGAHAATASGEVDVTSPWACTDSWRLNLPARQRLQLAVGEQRHVIELEHRGTGLLLHDEHGTCTVRIDSGSEAGSEAGVLVAELDDRRYRCDYQLEGPAIALWLEGRLWQLARHVPGAAAVLHASAGSLASPLPGQVIAVHVAAGDHVTAGQALVVVEAMKMEHVISAPGEGQVVEVYFAAGQRVDEGETLLQLQTD
jgi:3-methylcrotonyl-CoA carboxylase alpha subunit